MPRVPHGPFRSGGCLAFQGFVCARGWLLLKIEYLNILKRCARAEAGLVPSAVPSCWRHGRACRKGISGALPLPRPFPASSAQNGAFDSKHTNAERAKGLADKVAPCDKIIFHFVGRLRGSRCQEHTQSGHWEGGHRAGRADRCSGALRAHSPTWLPQIASRFAGCFLRASGGGRLACGWSPPGRLVYPEKVSRHLESFSRSRN